MVKFDHEQVLDLLREVRQRPSYPVYQRVGVRLSELAAQWQAPQQRRVRIALLSSFTIDPIKAYLQVSCAERGVAAEVFLPGYNQFTQQILAPDSELYAFDPHVCFLHVMPEALLSGFQPSLTETSSFAALIEKVKGLAKAFRSRCNADLVISNFAGPGRFPYSLGFRNAAQSYARVNDELEKAAKDIPGVYLLDYEGLTSYHGKVSVADERWRHIARMELSIGFLPKLANQMLAYVMALRGLGRKCIVLDLDDTLWGGVIGEEGVEGIHLGPDYPGSAFLEFQHSLLALQQRGILLAINSKNNEADVLEVLERHPAMLLRREHFAAMRINWRDKYENIEDIAEELNLGLESMVFIDDNPAERELMRRLRTEVLTPEWPADVVCYRQALESMCDFESLTVTAEDLNRGAMYTAEEKRKEARKRSASLEDYFFGLEMQVFVNQATESDVARFHQLVHKTNQFNLTSRRYSVADIQGFLQADDATAYVLRNRDALGDNGLVGVAVIKRDGPEEEDFVWRLDTLLMSCRVLGRTVETGFLKYILQELRTKGRRSVIGEFIPTKKNAMVKDFYPRHGFVEAGEKDGASRWALDLTAYLAPDLPWLSVNPTRPSVTP